METKMARLIVIALAVSVASASTPQEESWVSRSNRNSQVLLAVMEGLVETAE